MTKLATAIVAATALLLVPATVTAQCCGDCDGNGQVAINEVITAVGNALNGCQAMPCCGDCTGANSVGIPGLIECIGNNLFGCGPRPPTRTRTRVPTPTRTPPPTRAPNTPTPTVNPSEACPLDFTDTGGSLGCIFVGSWNANCGSDDLGSSFISDGEFVIFVFVNPDFFIGASIDGPRDAELIGYFTQPDASDIENLDGIATLGEAGTVLVILPAIPRFTINGCAFRSYVAAFLDTFVIDTRRNAGMSVDAPRLLNAFRARVKP